MPRIFDNISVALLPALTRTLDTAYRADFCVGYFNLRGWHSVESHIDHFAGGDGQCCRLIVGMPQSPHETLREELSLVRSEAALDNATAIRLKRRLSERFREQLAFGLPTGADERALRNLARQLREKKVVVKLHLAYLLHAKLYLVHREDFNNPVTGFVGSSNLTFSGLSNQGELNVDVVEHDAATKLSAWFDNRWNDRWCLDISDELLSVLEESWAIKTPTPYEIYINIAYHMSHEARAGLSEFRIPAELRNILFDFQAAAVKIAAHHLNKRGGVLIGDVVGLGKTLMATAVARIFEDDHGLETLIVCPKNLVNMWQDYAETYRLRARIVSVTRVQRDLPDLRRYRLVLIDESHNLRNREGKRYRAIRDYVEKNDCKCILLSATPYNKTYLDLSSQLRLFVAEDKALGVKPERFLRDVDSGAFTGELQAGRDTLAAFEKSEYPDDWRELMRLFMVRRTRSFIQRNYAKIDPDSQRAYLTFPDGSRSYFPVRKPKTLRFKIDDTNPADQYGQLYAESVVVTIGALSLPRYGLGAYATAQGKVKANSAEQRVLDDLGRAGKRLIGFCRTNLFKRLESSGQAFLLSLERHVLRNYVYLHAIANNKPIPIGTQDVELLDARRYDEDPDDPNAPAVVFDTGENGDDEDAVPTTPSAVGQRRLRTEAEFAQRAAEVYAAYASTRKKRFRWVRPDLFDTELAADLKADSAALIGILKRTGEWQPQGDTKLAALAKLIEKTHATDKILIFSQFADTVDYLTGQLAARNIKKLEGVTGDSPDPTDLAWRFSPKSNTKQAALPPDRELRVLLATDVLSEGQNLQDAHIVVNYDLPWAIIRLIQRAGRVDRIGQHAQEILCYTFMPADGVERLIRLRARLRQRLSENAEVVGTDESFFEDDRNDQAVRDLYSEKAGIMDGDADSEVDLASYAYQIWKNAIDRDPSLAKRIPALESVVYSTRAPGKPEHQPGAIVYARTSEDNDTLAWIGADGESVTDSQLAILNGAECEPATPAVSARADHHDLVRKAIEKINAEERSVGGQLGRPSGARYKAYHRLQRHAASLKGTLFASPELDKAINELYQYPLRSGAAEALNRQLRTGIEDDALAQLVIALREEGKLCVVGDQDGDGVDREPRLICSLGLTRNQ